MQKLDLNPANPNLTAPTPTITNYSAAETGLATKPGLPLILVILVLGLALAAGSATGFGSFKLFGQKGGGSSAPLAQIASGTLKAGDVFGSQDTDTFKDNAQGYLVVGGVEGEGSHRLVRESSDPVYLTSSVTDLDKFTGMIIKVWGETYKAQKAGWLMDVGRVEVVDPEAETPPGLQPNDSSQSGD